MYRPAPVPLSPQELIRFLQQEFARVSQAIASNAPIVMYRTAPANQGSLTAGISANYKIANGNIVRISTSATVTLTGIAITDPSRELVLVNIGTGVVVLKSEGTESSASYRFALPADWHLSANAAAVLWRDAYSSRWRGLSRTH